MIVFLLTCFTVFVANVEFLQLQILQACALDVCDPKSTLQREFPCKQSNVCFCKVCERWEVVLNPRQDSGMTIFKIQFELLTLSLF